MGEPKLLNSLQDNLFPYNLPNGFQKSELTLKPFSSDRLSSDIYLYMRNETTISDYWPYL